MRTPQAAYIFSIDGSDRTVLVNEALRAITGYAQRDIPTYQDVLRVLFHKTREEFEAMYGARKEAGPTEGKGPIEQILPVFCRDGSRVAVRWRIEFLADAAGQPAGRIGIGVAAPQHGPRGDQVSDTGARYKVMREGRDLPTLVSDLEPEAAKEQEALKLRALEEACEQIASAQGEQQAVEWALNAAQGEPFGADVAGCCFVDADGEAKLLYSSHRVLAPTAGKAFKASILAASKEAGIEEEPDPASEVFSPVASKTDQAGTPIADVASFLSTSLQADGKCIGVLCLGSARPDAFDARHEPMLPILAAQLGSALARAQRTARLEAANDRLRHWASQIQASVLDRQGDVSVAGQKLQALLANLKEGVLVVDAKGEITSINTAAREMLGLGELPPEGRPIGLLDDALDEPQRNLLQILTQAPSAREHGAGAAMQPPRGERWEKELTVQHPNAARLAVLFCPITSETEGLLAGVYILRDLTPAGGPDDAISDVIDIISRDLRGPLTSIVGFTSLLGESKMGKLSPRQLEVLERVRRQSGRLLGLLNNLLDVARIDRGAFQLEMGRVQMQDLLASRVAELTPSAALKRVELRLSIPGHLPEVSGDAARLGQAISALVDNAIFVSPPGGTVEIKAHADANCLLVSVSDRGPGVPRSLIPSIFDKFSRALPKGKRADGSGLGLYLAAHIVRGHEGKIWLDPGPGKGSTFNIALPLASETTGQKDAGTQTADED